MSIMAAQTDRLLDRPQRPGSAHSTDPPPQFHWEAITLTSWHSLHSSWVCMFSRASRRVRREKEKKRLMTTFCCLRQQLDAPLNGIKRKATLTCRKYAKLVFCIQTEIHKRIRIHKPKNSLLCCICMHGFFAYSSSNIILRSDSGKPFL